MKIIILMVLIVLFTIFTTQNTLVIPVQLFFWRVEMSVIVLISICTLMGVLAGFILAKIFDRPSPKKLNNEANKTKTDVSRGSNPIL